MQQPAERPTARQIVDSLRSAIHLTVRDDIKLTETNPVVVDAFGEVWKGLTLTGEVVAVKVLRVREGNDAKLLKVPFSYCLCASRFNW
jgi:hypothetical protein